VQGALDSARLWGAPVEVREEEGDEAKLWRCSPEHGRRRRGDTIAAESFTTHKR
jgi:hypothetical protein